MEPFDTTAYELQRKEDNTVVRVFGNGFEEPELTQEQHQYNVDFHQQIVDNSQAQLDKLKAFEDANPPVGVEEAVETSDEDAVS
jgi:hypothetical protein